MINLYLKTKKYGLPNGLVLYSAPHEYNSGSYSEAVDVVDNTDFAFAMVFYHFEYSNMDGRNFRLKLYYNIGGFMVSPTMKGKEKQTNHFSEITYLTL